MKEIKNTNERIRELEKDVKNLEDSISNLQKSNDKSHGLDISPELRDVVRTVGSNIYPLLLELSEDLNIPLNIFSIPQKGNKPNKKFLSYLIGGRTWTTKQENGWNKYGLNDWMQLPFYYSGESRKYHSRDQIVKYIVDNDGETSDASHIIESLFKPSQQNRNNEDIVSILSDVTQAILWLGNRVLLVFKYKDLSNNKFLSSNLLDEELNHILYSINILDNKYERLKF